MIIINEKFLEVLKHEGVVTIVTMGENKPHISNTWNSYVEIKDDKILIPAAYMKRTEKNIKENGILELSIGSKEVEGYNGYQGTGFYIEGEGKFLENGETFEMMKEKYPFLTRVLEVSIKTIKQKI